MKRFLASAVGASLLGAGALGMTPLGLTAGVAQAAERPVSTPAEAGTFTPAHPMPSPGDVTGTDQGDVTGTVDDQNGNDEGDVTGTVGDVTGTGHGDHSSPKGGSLLGNTLTTIAGVLGIPEADLVAALESGQSLAGIATAHNVDPQKVIDALVAGVRSHLDAAVAAGFLTQAQEGEILRVVTDAITGLVNATPPVPGHANAA